MFVLNALPPFLVFNTDPDNGGGTGTPPAQDAPKVELDGESFDFHAATPTDSMTPDQRAEYWRHESKKKQKALAPWLKLGSYDDVTATVQAAKDAAEAALTPEQKADQAALDKAKQDGFTQARDLYAKPALASIIATRTARADETPEQATTRVAGILSVLDVQAFIGTDGALDATKVDTFAQSLAPSAGNGTPPAPQSGDLLQQVFGGATPPSGDSGGSVAAYREAAAKRFQPKQ